MIVLNEQKIIFLKPRKVAGTSFEIALSRYAQPLDVVTPITEKDEDIRAALGFSGPRNYLDGDGKMIFKNHMSAAQINQKLGGDVWRGFKKISIVRNPFDVYVSLFFYHNGKEAELSEISNWYLEGKGANYLGANNRQYFIKSDLVIDRFLRYEFLKEDVLSLEDEVFGLNGLYTTFSEIKAKSGFRPSLSFDFSGIFASHKKLRSIIEQLHEFEIKAFGYSLE